MSVIKKLAWHTSDGKVFTDSDAAYEHEYSLNCRSTVDTFLVEGSGKEYTARGKSTAERIIVDFLDHLDAMGMAMPWALSDSSPKRAVDCPRPGGAEYEPPILGEIPNKATGGAVRNR